MVEPRSIIVQHIPCELSAANQEELLKLFGAKSVRCVAKKDKTTSIAYATFDTHEEAKHALLKLHQLQILNHRLLVQFAEDKDKNQLPKDSNFPTFKPSQPEYTKPAKASGKENLKLEAEEFTRKLHGLCPSLGLDYIPSPLLKYKYPPPNAAIIANISHALVSVPKFYTQVLHLMNKMNLPAPFGPITPAPPLSDLNTVNYEQDYQNSDIHEVEEMDTGTEEESEIESEEDTTNPKASVAVPIEKPKKVKTKKRRREQKYYNFVPPNPLESKTADNRTEPSDVFESQQAFENLASRKIQFNITSSLKPKLSKESEKPSIEGTGFGIIPAPRLDKDPNSDTDKSGVESLQNPKFISSEELRQKRISASEMKTSSAFRNYSPGEPTVRLYIKNLARQVVEKDLRYIFGRFINWDLENERNMFDIRLMTEGRMKGQAFVTLASEKQAIQAVKETNGYVLHTKPLVVQFARSAKPKETPQKPQEKNS